ncbi:uncharacterized protein LOC130743740 [Lotus japonicus]|uniref:uncharacterized protein LOC130743740 n=1 Tax=Lotus japonicus TaxID=34305 RepID=UPI002584A477|nr:uncharacterized protein LOC130743740 [Lotus japonicus]
MRAQPPLRGRQEPLLNETFFNDCISCYAVIPRIQQGQQQSFVKKFMDIIDPLRKNNNLGRSVSRGSFLTIKNAISDGAEKLEQLLHCPVENLIAQFDFIFMNTWARNGNGFWMHLDSYNIYIRNMNVVELTSQDQASQGSYRIHQNPANYLVESKQICGPSDVSAVSQTGSSKNKGIFIGEVTSDVSSSKASQPDEVRGYWTPHSTSESAASYLQALQISSSISSQGPMCGPGTLARGTHVLAGPGSNMNPEPHGSTSENYAEQGSDTLCGDFGNYWINLQYVEKKVFQFHEHDGSWCSRCC